MLVFGSSKGDSDIHKDDLILGLVFDNSLFDIVDILGLNCCNKFLSI